MDKLIVEDRERQGELTFMEAPDGGFYLGVQLRGSQHPTFLHLNRVNRQRVLDWLVPMRRVEGDLKLAANQ